MVKGVAKSINKTIYAFTFIHLEDAFIQRGAIEVRIYYQSLGKISSFVDFGE